MKKLKVLTAILLCMSMAVCLVYAGDSHFDSVVAQPSNGSPTDGNGLQVLDSNGNQLYYVDNAGTNGLTMFKAATLVVSSTANYTMSQAEGLATVLITSSCPIGGPCTVMAPAIAGKVFTVINSSVGTVIIRTTTSSGVAIGAQKAAVVANLNGVAYIRISADVAVNTY